MSFTYGIQIDVSRHSMLCGAAVHCVYALRCGGVQSDHNSVLEVVLKNTRDMQSLCDKRHKLRIFVQVARSAATDVLRCRDAHIETTR